MTDYTELKRLLEGCKESNCADASDFGRRVSDLYEYLDPETVAEMVAEIEALKGPHEWLAEDLIKELVDNAQAIQENACEESEDPFVIVLLAAASRIRRQEANIDKLRAESLHINNAIAIAASSDAESLAEQCRGLLTERDDLKAELAGLRTGFDAQNEVIAGLKAENARSSEREILQLAESEALLKCLEGLVHVSNATGWEEHTCGEIAKARRLIDAAMSKGEQP